MRRILASLDIGSNTIKMVVGEIIKNKLNVLSCVESPSAGIKKGFIVNSESAFLALKDVFTKTENLIGMPIKSVLVSVPSYNEECFITEGSTIITSDNRIITHEDVIKAMQDSIAGRVLDNKELVSLLPTKFIIDDEKTVSSPINMSANKLSVNAVAVVIPKNNSNNIIKTLEKMNIKVIDIVTSNLADYYEFKEDSMSSLIGAVVNIGQNNTSVSIFNKGVLTACEVIDTGTVSIDNDLAYVFKINKKDANLIKERIVNLDINLANPAENIIIKNINEEEIKINEYDASAVVISRLSEILELAKKQINLLTKKEISYIIITGGIGACKHFDVLLESHFGDKASLGNINEIGARHLKYSVALGMIRYYNSRLKLRNVNFSIFNEDEEEDFGGTHRRINLNENSILGKIYGYFFDN